MWGYKHAYVVYHLLLYISIILQFQLHDIDAIATSATVHSNTCPSWVTAGAAGCIILLCHGFKHSSNCIWRHPRKSGLTPKTTKVMVVRYAIIQSPQCFSELTHSSSEASIWSTYVIQVSEYSRILNSII